MQYDVAIVGGGIAGVSVGAWLAPKCSVVVLESEDSLGYHATGRSAASYTECYGSPAIRALARASRPYLVAGDGLAHRQPVMFVAPPRHDDRLDELYQEFSVNVPTLRRLSPSEVAESCSAFDRDSTAGGVLEPEALDLDVHGLLTGFAQTIRRNGGEIVTGFETRSIQRSGDRWHLYADDAELSASVVVNAAGAWGDSVASMAGVDPLGLDPLMRSVFTFATDRDTARWPLVVDADEGWYFRPEGPNVLGSGASELPSAAVDARPSEIDVALGIEKVNNATNLQIRSVRNTWAGLRTFTSDRIPAVGFDRGVKDFFWLVGQGGYGIKTSPALGELAACLVLGQDPPSHVTDAGVTPEELSPSRFSCLCACPPDEGEDSYGYDQGEGEPLNRIPEMPTLRDIV